MKNNQKENNNKRKDKIKGIIKNVNFFIDLKIGFLTKSKALS